MSDTVISYTAEPTLARFHNSRARFRCIRGPVGSGKSVACCMEIILSTANRMPPMDDGVIRAKWLVIRNTFNELKTTTVATMSDWFSKIGLSMHMSPPLEGKICTVAPNGMPMEIELLFWGMDQPGTENSLQSLEISGIWANEACQIAYSRIAKAATRLGRYPKKSEKTSYPALGVIMDTNSPDNTNWWYKKETERPEGWEFFVQPPALLRVEDPVTHDIRYENNVGQDPGVPAAENVGHHNEGFNYYRNMLMSSTAEQIETLILNRFGTRKFGKPVYPEYIDSVHCAKEPIEFLENMPIGIGQDFGRTPAAVIGQMTLSGQIRLLAEVVSDNMGIEQFVREKLKPLLINRFGFYRARIFCFGDPAGADPNQVDDVTCIQKMNDMGIYTVPSPVVRGVYSNSQIIRVNTVSEQLNRRIGSDPALLVSPTCTTLREGFNGGYHYRKMRISADDDERYTDEPEKNMFSHVHDAAQYLVCGFLNSGVNFQSPYGTGAATSYEMSQILSGAGSGMGPFA